MNMMRQSIAMSLGVLGFEYWRNVEKKNAFICVFIAFLFHTSSLLILLIYLLYDYIVKGTKLSFCNVVIALISVCVYPSIHILKLISGFLFILQPLIFGKYAKKNYRINWKVEPDNSLIQSRWNGFAINLAAFIHNSTDITVLTFLSIQLIPKYVMPSLNQNIEILLGRFLIFFIGCWCGKKVYRQEYISDKEKTG